MITKVVKFFKSKSVIDFLYLVMMIIVVTMIKDMVVSMYRKKGEMRWLDETFKKKEGFTTVVPDDCPSGTTSTCDRLKFLTCTTNFDNLNNLINNAKNLNDLASIENYNILQKYIGADIIKHDGDTKDISVNTNTLEVDFIRVRQGGSNIEVQTSLNLGENGIIAGDISAGDIFSSDEINASRFRSRSGTYINR